MKVPGPKKRGGGGGGKKQKQKKLCTAGYNDGVETDANETQIAMCTLRSFPFLRGAQMLPFWQWE